MITTIKDSSGNLQIDLQHPLDITIPITGVASNVNAWYVSHPEIAPAKDDDFEISVANGAAVNFNNISFNPHAHGTHTETVGHITEEKYPIHKHLKTFFFKAEVITVAPEKVGEDMVISKKQLQYALGQKKREAVVIRTIPNMTDKKNKQYSHTNPPYLCHTAASFLKEKGIKHLLIDLPSVDKEKDDGELLAHKAFWNYGGALRLDATITEFIYVSNNIEDGCYMLNLQVTAFDNDAAPSRPVLYKILNK